MKKRAIINDRDVTGNHMLLCNRISEERPQEPPKVVRELYGVMAAKNVKHGIVVTYGAFTSEASDFAKANLIALIDGPKLTQMIASVQQSGNMQPQQEVARACPKCSSEMVLRVAKKGPHSGNEFWGCSKFPGCRGVVSAGS
jgi:restriction system protein